MKAFKTICRVILAIAMIAFLVAWAWWLTRSDNTEEEITLTNIDRSS